MGRIFVGAIIFGVIMFFMVTFFKDSHDWDKWEVVEENIDFDVKKYDNPMAPPVGVRTVKADRLRRVCKKTGDIEYKVIRRN